VREESAWGAMNQFSKRAVASLSTICRIFDRLDTKKLNSQASNTQRVEG